MRKSKQEAVPYLCTVSSGMDEPLDRNRCTVFPEFTVTYKNYTKQKDVLVPKKLDIKGNDFLLRINITKWEL